MPYSIFVSSFARRELGRLPATLFSRIDNQILLLSAEPRPRGVIKLSGYNAFRLRVGDYRVLYTVDDADRQITILKVAHRRDVYR